MEKQNCTKSNGRRRSSYFESLTPKTPYYLEKFLSRDTVSGLKYAIIWVVYVVLGSWLFLVLEKTTVKSFTPHPHWARFKELLTFGGIFEEMEHLHRALKSLCPLHLSNMTFTSPSLFSDTDDNTSSNYSIITIEGVETMEWLAEIEEKCNESLSIIEWVEIQEVTGYSMVDAVYYTMTLVTTIGYGHIYPTTEKGRVFSIIYALVGVPLTCILMAKNSNILSNRLVHIYESIKRRYSSMNPKTVLGIVTWMYLSIGFIVFMFLPSMVFVVIEDWTYIESLYYTFITLSTIGFGEYIGGYHKDEYPKDFYLETYRVCIILWIMIALGYWVLLLNFLQKAIKNNVPKKIKRSFSKSRRIAKQAEFLRHIISKVNVRPLNILSKVHQKHEENLDMSQDDNNKDIMNLVVEMAGNLSRRTSMIPGSRKASLVVPQLPLSRRTSIVPGENKMDEFEGDDEKLLTFADLMDIPVTIKSRTVPGLMSLVSRVSINSDQLTNDNIEGASESTTISPSIETRTTISSTDTKSIVSSVSETKCLLSQDNTPLASPIHAQKPLENGLDKRSRSSSPEKTNDNQEVTIPLRDVLSIMLFVASCEDDTYPSMTSLDPRDSMPRLKNIFYRKNKNFPVKKKRKYSENTPSLEDALEDYLHDGMEEEDEDSDNSSFIQNGTVA